MITNLKSPNVFNASQVVLQLADFSHGNPIITFPVPLENTVIILHAPWETCNYFASTLELCNYYFSTHGKPYLLFPAYVNSVITLFASWEAYKYFFLYVGTL